MRLWGSQDIYIVYSIWDNAEAVVAQLTEVGRAAGLLNDKRDVTTSGENWAKFRAKRTRR